MFPTVSEPEIRESRSSDAEIYRLANATRAAANMVSRVRVTTTTVHTGVFTTIWTSAEMPEGSAWAIDYAIVWRTTAGVAGRGRYDQNALFYREPAGAATQQGATGTVAPAIESIAAFSAQFAIVGNTIVVQVLDDGVSTADWDAFIEVREVR